MLNKQEFLEILSAQYDLNTAYNGNEWKSRRFVALFQAAADTEHAEFLEEITAQWKWYARAPVMECNAALFEMIDVLHFAMSALLAGMTCYGMDKEQCLTRAAISFDCVANSDNFPKQAVKGLKFEDSYPTLRFHLNGALNDAFRLSKAFISEGGHANNFYLQGCIISICEWLSHASGLIGYSSIDVMKAYRMKRERNLQRVARGVMSGVDVKVGEEPLCV